MKTFAEQREKYIRKKKAATQIFRDGFRKVEKETKSLKNPPKF